MNARTLKLLVVEDDEGDFMMIERAFEKSRIVNEIVRAKDGVEALEIMRGAGGRERLMRPYLVLCDINMPRLDGLSFVAALRDDPELKDTLVFMLTTSRHDEDRREAYDMNVAGYILKSDAGKDFLKVVDMLGGFIQVVVLP
jgi:CheY-like chemotaxis protein